MDTPNMIGMRAPWLAILAGCSFSTTITAGDADKGDDSSIDTFDASTMLDVVHLSSAEEAKLVGTATWTITEATTIRTSGGTPIQPSPPAGVVVLAPAPQESGGGNVMVIQAQKIVIDAPVIVEGSLPLILVATDTLELTATIDAAAKMNTAGPGGAGPAQGMGTGGNGQGGNGEADCGGGGGGFQSAGAVGGDCAGALGGSAGAAFVPAVLVGGSGGGNSSPSSCAMQTGPRGGAGGGALQLSAGVSITLSGAATIDVGGGGGARGRDCDFAIGWDGASGAGGGSGGMLYLQAPMLLGTGALYANGGGGGGAANSNDTEGTNGGNGGPSAGTGGPGGSGGGNGGDGAAANAAVAGENKTGTDENGGGGGGGTGWIFIRTTTGTVPYASSPPVTPN